MHTSSLLVITIQNWFWPAKRTHLHFTWFHGATLQDLHHLEDAWVCFFKYFGPHVNRACWQWCDIAGVTRLRKRSRRFKCTTWKFSRVLSAKQILSDVSAHRVNRSPGHWFWFSFRFVWLIEGKIPIFRVIVQSWIRKRTLFTWPEGKICRNEMERLN